MIKPHKLADGRYECQNCMRKFTRNKKATIEPKFCGDNCRKEFHTTGGMSLRKLRDLIEREVDKRFDARLVEMFQRIESDHQRTVDKVKAMLRPASFRKGML